jgi:hypothetical protein
MPQSTVWIRMDGLMCNIGLKMMSKFEEHHPSGLPHPFYDSDKGPCDFWLLGMLKGFLTDREFNSNDEIQELIALVWNELPFDDVQSIFRNWMNDKGINMSLRQSQRRIIGNLY